jgi:hypothetical protein
MTKIWILITLLLNIAFADVYFVNPSSTRGKNVFDSRLDFSIFNTENLFQTSGEKTPLPSGNSFEMSNLDLNLFYGLADDFDMNLGIRGRKNQSEVSGAEYSNDNFESFWLTIKYLLSNSERFTSSIELLFRSTFYANGNSEIQSQKLILGDAGQEEALFLNGGFKFNHNFYTFGRFGINWPENILSTEAIYDFKFSFLWEPLRFDLGIGGTISFYKSPYPSLEAAREAFNLNTGASYLFVSWNRQSTIPYAEISYLAGDFNFGAYFKSIVAGKSTDNGNFFGLYISYHIGEPREPFKGFKYVSSDFRYLGKTTYFGRDYIRILSGFSSDLEKGQEVYFFKEVSGGKEILIATGKIEEIGVNWSVIKISEKLNKKYINEPLLAKVLIK